MSKNLRADPIIGRRRATEHADYSWFRATLLTAHRWLPNNRACLPLSRLASGPHIGRPGLASRKGVPVSAKLRNNAEGCHILPDCCYHTPSATGPPAATAPSVP